MPELPEVETVRRGLVPALRHHRIKSVTLRRGDLRWPFPRDFARRLTGRRVERLERRAKYILAYLDNGEVLLVHLGMTGRFLIVGGHTRRKLGSFHHAAAEPGTGKHDHVVIETDAGTRIVFSDHRRFGAMDLIPEQSLSAHKLLKGLGPEPLDPAFTGPTLAARLDGKRTSIKAALMDQRVVAGLGNIYVCEVLFRAKISPSRLAGACAGPRAAALAAAIKKILKEAIASGGSTLRDYAQADGELGYFQHNFAVYDREGDPCRAKGCHARIRRIVQGGRATFFCPACQR